MSNYRALVTLAAATLIGLAGCSSDGSVSDNTGGGSTGASGASSVYVLQNNSVNSNGSTVIGKSDTVYQLSASANGVSPSTASINLPTSYLATGVAVDSAGNIYVAARNIATNASGEVLVYAAGSTGAATPLRTIAGAATGIDETTDIALDASGQLYLVDQHAFGISPAILVFAAGATGNVAPTRTIQGVNTGFNAPVSIAVDSTGNIYTAAPNATGAIDVFSSTANGNVAPTRTITNAAGNGIVYFGLALDSANNIYVSTEDPTVTYPSITEFAAGASGVSTPVRTIGGSAVGFEATIGGLAVDAKGDIFANLSVNGTGYTQIIAYSPTATGNVAPTATASLSGYVSSYYSAIAIH